MLFEAMINNTSKPTALPNNTSEPLPFYAAQEETKIPKNRTSRNNYLAQLEEENK